MTQPTPTSPPITGPLITGPLITGQGGKGRPARPSFYEAADTIASSGRAHILCLLSAGPIAGLADGAASILLDDVPLEPDESAISWQISDGLPDQPPARLPGFNASESEQPIGRHLTPGVPVQVSRKLADSVRVTFRFPHGLVHRTRHVIGPETVGLKIEIASTGQAHTKTANWHTAWQDNVTHKQTSAFELQITLSLPDTPGPFALRVTRTTALADDPLIADEIVLSSVTWMLWDKLSYPGLATFALSVEANRFKGRLPRLSLDIKGRLIRIPDNYTPATRSYSGIWSGRFVTAWTDNPAWVIYDLLVDPLWGLGVDPSLIDRFALYQIARWCDQPVAAGEGGGPPHPRFTFNAVLDRRQSAMRVLGDICAAIHCLMLWSGRQLTFTHDSADAPCLMVTKSAVIDGRFVYQDRSAGDQISHALVRWRRDDGRLETEIAIDQDSLARFGYRAAEVFVPGCTRAAQARRHARWLLAAQHRHAQIVSWRAGLDHLADHPVRPGDVILIDDPGHAAPAANVQSERLQAAGFESLLSTLPLRPDERAYIIRNRPHFTAQTGRFMGIPLSPPTALVPPPRPQIATGQFRFIERASDPARNLYVVRFRPGTDGLYPLDGCAVYFADSATLHAARKWQVAEVRQTAADACEVTAFTAPPDRATLIDVASPGAAPARPIRPDLNLRPAAATALTVQQFERQTGHQITPELELTWTSADGPPPRFWQVQMTGPDGQPRTQTSSAPHLLITGLTPGDWHFTVTPIGWQGQAGTPAKTTLTIAADITGGAALPAPYAQPKPEAIRLTWTAPPAGGVASYEVWQMTPSGQPARQLATTLGQAATLTDLAPGTAYSLAVRYKRLSGALSGFSPHVISTPLAPHIPRDGRDGTDGTDGTDGRDGRAGTQLLTITRTAPGWSDALAEQAITDAAHRPPAIGDIVTQRTPDTDTGTHTAAPPTAQTRIWDGTAWAAGGQILNGNLLIPGTIAAHALLLDGTSLTTDTKGALSVAHISADRITGGRFTSRFYRPGRTGFVIDSAGHAEFNAATIRGTLDSSIIRASRLISSAITHPTEAGARFATLAAPRPIVPRWTTLDAPTNANTTAINLLDLQIADDDHSRFSGDAHNPVLTAADTYGDNADHSDNTYLSRFHRFAPHLELACRYDAPPEMPSSAHINAISPRLRVTTKSGLLLADTGLIRLPPHRQSRQSGDFVRETSSTAPRFSGTIDIIQQRTARRASTASFTFKLRCRPNLNPSTPLHNQPLSLHLTLTLDTTAPTSNAPTSNAPTFNAPTFNATAFAALARTLTLTMDTLS